MKWLYATGLITGYLEGAMPNRTQEENDAIMLNALDAAGEKGMTLDELTGALFDHQHTNKSLTKKMLERLKQKGRICIKMNRAGPYYVILPGHKK